MTRGASRKAMAADPLALPRLVEIARAPHLERMSEAITRLNAALRGPLPHRGELGEGGMATVYLADHIKHERKVALEEVLKPELAAVVGAKRFPKLESVERLVPSDA